MATVNVHFWKKVIETNYSQSNQFYD